MKRNNLLNCQTIQVTLLAQSQAITGHSFSSKVINFDETIDHMMKDTGIDLVKGSN